MTRTHRLVVDAVTPPAFKQAIGTLRWTAHYDHLSIGGDNAEEAIGLNPAHVDDHLQRGGHPGRHRALAALALRPG